MSNKSTVNQNEMAHFSKLANEWWRVDGELKTLHDINPSRMLFVEKYTTLAQKSLLDVGCGGGILSEALSQAGADVTGLDSEGDSIAVAKHHAKQNQLNIHYVSQPIETFEHPSFDIITCMEMLEHVDYPEKVIKHIARLVKPGGYVFLSTINRTLQAYLGAIIAGEYLLKIIPRHTHDYQKFIRPSELARVLRQNGLKILDVEGLGYNPLTRHAYLQKSVQINYLMACQKID